MKAKKDFSRSDKKWSQNDDAEWIKMKATNKTNTMPFLIQYMRLLRSQINSQLHPQRWNNHNMSILPIYAHWLLARNVNVLIPCEHAFYSEGKLYVSVSNKYPYCTLNFHNADLSTFTQNPIWIKNYSPW